MKARSSSRQALISSGHTLTTEAAAATLLAGGNAFDAAVAAGFASAVTEPMLTSLGGGGFLLARTVTGEAILFDFFVDTPGRGLPKEEQDPHFFPVIVHFGGSDQPFNIGLGSVAVPGNLKGYLHVHQRLGRLPLSQVVAPAIAFARNGVRLNSRQAYLVKILTPILTLTEAGSAIYAPRGTPLMEGEILVNRDLAVFLEDLPHAHDEPLYGGELARRVNTDMAKGRGLLTSTDLGAYTVIERQPLSLEYRGHRLLTNPPPSFGGSLLSLSLCLLGTQDLSSLDWQSPEHLTLLLGVMLEVDKLRADGCLGADALCPEARNGAAVHLRRFSRGTTHFSVADAEGNIASMTTSNGEGSGYVVPGTGIMLNNMMGEDDLHPEGFHRSEPGERVASMMSPSAVLRDGTVRLVLGSGGSKRIRTALFQVISHVLDFDLAIEKAVTAPRLHWDGECVQMEPGFADTLVESLQQHRKVNLWEEQNLYFGGVNAVAIGAGACADPRRGGTTRVIEVA